MLKRSSQICQANLELQCIALRFEKKRNLYIVGTLRNCIIEYRLFFSINRVESNALMA